MGEIERLRLVIAAAQAGGIGEAARQENTSQPVVSRAITRVETDLGYRIFVRKPSGVSLCDRAIPALAQMRSIVEDYDTLFRPGQLQPLRIGYAWAGLTPTLESTLQRWRTQTGEPVELLQFDDPIEALANLRIDLAVTRKPEHSGARRTEHFTVVPFAPEPRVFAINAEHPLASQHVLSLGQVCAEMTLVINSTTGSVPHDLWGHYTGEPVYAHNSSTWLERIAADTNRFGVTSAATAEFDIHPHVSYITGADIPHAQIQLITSTPPSSGSQRLLQLTPD